MRRIVWHNKVGLTDALERPPAAVVFGRALPCCSRHRGSIYLPMWRGESGRYVLNYLRFGSSLHTLSQKMDAGTRIEEMRLNVQSSMAGSLKISGKECGANITCGTVAHSGVQLHSGLMLGYVQGRTPSIKRRVLSMRLLESE